MSRVAPKGRTSRSADALFGWVRSGFAHNLDDRLSETDRSGTEARMSAFAMVSLTSPSRLACDKERAAGHWHTIDGSDRVPCETHMREILDPISPEA